ncbi:MAG: DUF3105 domain-containing protein [Chloroflexi bacterium]|nr:DUF3105 domain-containing protein [Chloroflexota bacterium]
MARPTKRERREQRREATRVAKEAAERQSRVRRWIIIGASAAILAVAAVLGVPAFVDALRPAPVLSFVDQGREHVDPAQPTPLYNSNPPTSGPHYQSWAPWGVHDQELPDPLLVHNLEHGGVIVHYNCPEACPELVNQLRDLVGSYRSKVILAPRPRADVPALITLTAWTKMDRLDAFDAQRIRAFVERFRDKGPELVPD